MKISSPHVGLQIVWILKKADQKDSFLSHTKFQSQAENFSACFSEKVDNWINFVFGPLQDPNPLFWNQYPQIRATIAGKLDSMR